MDKAAFFREKKYTMTALHPSVYAISTGPRDGSWNMAFDTQLLTLFRTGKFQKLFGRGCMLWRFYAWNPPALSLGHGQHLSEIDEESCKTKNIEIVKRPTGGRAVLHIDEFTYSFFAETCKTNAEIYTMVHEAIREALLILDVKAEFCRTTPDMRKRYGSAESVSCFTASARNELHVDGRKLVGSAQRRSDKIILQHGSLLLSGRHKMLKELLHCKNEKILSQIADDLNRKTVSVHELTGKIPPFTTIKKAMISAISKQLKTDIQLLKEQDITHLF